MSTQPHNTNTVEAKREAITFACDALYEAIDALGEVPSGVLYAHLMGQMSLNTYNGLISLLVAQKRISISNHLITINR